MSKSIIIKTSFENFRTTKIPTQGPIKKEISFNSSSAKVEFWIEIFMDQVKPVVTEKHEFEKRHVSRFRNLFGKHWNIKLLMRRTESTALQLNGLAQVENCRLRA